MDSYDLDPGRIEGRNLLMVIGGGGEGLSGGCRWHTTKEEVITKTVSSPLDKDSDVSGIYAETGVLLLWQSRSICMMLVTCTSCIMRVNLP